MTKFKNYNTAKFVTIFLSQLRKPDEKDGVDYKKKCSIQVQTAILYVPMKRESRSKINGI